MERAGFTEVLVDRDADQVDQGEHQADGERGEALGGAGVGDAQDHEHEERHQQDLGQEHRPPARSGRASGRRSRWWRSPALELKPSVPRATPTEQVAAATAATTWVSDVVGTSFQSKRLPAASPMETAGLKWPPEMCPTA